MIEAREVLRRWQAGQKLGEIAGETRVDRKTVRRYITWAEGCEVRLDTPLTDEVVHLVAQGVQARPDAPPSEPREQLAPHRERIQAWLDGDGEHRPLRLTKVHHLLARQGVAVIRALSGALAQQLRIDSAQMVEGALASLLQRVLIEPSYTGPRQVRLGPTPHGERLRTYLMKRSEAE